ncbi:MAG: phosphoadenosine phosphosulfate reductase family protein [Asgard group archaeon]|nr:phosphoadenosine phosphosulfate reductase family protein [Asgard group archaeon]
MSPTKYSPFLGEFKLSWCPRCNVPILDNQACDLCGGSSYRVPIAPPGDIRPAFQGDIKRMQNLLDMKFGTDSAKSLGITSDSLILLNEVSYDDLMMEVIIDGQIMGAIRYDLTHERWDFVLRMAGAQRIFSRPKHLWKSYVEMDEGAVPYIIKGYNILAPGIVSLDESLTEGEGAVAIGPKGQVLSTGLMQVSAQQARSMEKGMVLKPKYPKGKQPTPPKIANNKKSPPTWDDVVKANIHILKKYEEEALQSIKNILSNNPQLPLSVSFSGGKDSLVCLQLARKLEEQQFYTLFVNTGLEFPETISYIETIVKNFGLEKTFCREDISQEKFWDAVEQFGPPGKDYRFCCKILKIGPVNALIDRCIGEKTISLVGQRTYESIARSHSKKTWTNPWIPNQINFSPIQEWTALHVWLYIFQEDLPYNQLYDFGFPRIGCWLCPACHQGIFELVKKIHPKRWEEWENFLKIKQKEHDYPNEWITWGLWRWQTLPQKIVNLLEQENITYPRTRSRFKQQEESEREFTLSQGMGTCQSGDVFLEGTFHSSVDLQRIQAFWEIFCETTYDDELGLLTTITDEDFSISLAADGTITFSGCCLDNLLNSARLFVEEVFRALECTGCEVCISHCAENALQIDPIKEQVIINHEKCSRCGNCHAICPIVKFGHKTLTTIFSANNLQKKEKGI